MSQIHILPFQLCHQELLLEHFQRHRAESGAGGIHFMPFAPGDPTGPRGVSVDEAFSALDHPGWQRWFCAHDVASGLIIGHVDLKSDSLSTGLHRCELGIGIESAYRKNGLGRRLMTEAIGFVSESNTIDWIDLRVFSNNLPARSLYQSLGFVEIGTITDRFRIDSQRIDDVMMTFQVP